ncbi:hypothetical protein [Bacteroides nordii]|uniref:hypothetical protein n=1 Tax=Bacteroides nordii TaxID=291645 RepID=UPI0021E6AC49|nr:hypothetical protein [Bacteroides nordii]
MSKKRKSAAPSRSGKRSADNGYKDIDKYINSVLDFIKLHGAPEEYDEVWVNPEIKRMCFIKWSTLTSVQDFTLKKNLPDMRPGFFEKCMATLFHHLQVQQVDIIDMDFKEYYLQRSYERRSAPCLN